MTATKNNSPGRSAASGTPVAGRIFKFFVSIRLTITVLSLIAATSVLGTLVKQGGTEEEYLALYTEKTYRFIKLLGFDDAYHSTWFYFLIALFAANLALCTLRRIGRGKKAAVRPSVPDIDRLMASGMGFTAPSAKGEELARKIPGGYRKKQVSDECLLYEKGSLSRHGVTLIHASVIIILLGGVYRPCRGIQGFHHHASRRNYQQGRFEGRKEHAGADRLQDKM